MRAERTIGAACGFAITLSAFGQCAPAWTHEGPNTEGYYGWGTANLGDLTGDGNSDIVSQFYSGTDGETGYAFVSAVDGDPIEVCDLCEFEGFGALPLGDVDGDGIAEWLRVHAYAGVSVMSGRQTVLWTHAGEGLGAMVCGDLDGDGVADFGVGDPDASTTTVYSGATRQMIAGLPIACDGGMGIEDISGDGLDDFILWEAFTGATVLHAFSGADLSVLYTVPGNDYFGATMASVGDVDGDQAADFACTAPNYRSGGVSVGLVVLLSGATGDAIGEVVGSALEPISAVFGAGDWNLDGVRDIVLSCPGADHHGINSGRASFRSGDDLRVIDRIDGALAGDSLGATKALVEGLPGQTRPGMIIAETGYTGTLTDQGRISLHISRCPADFSCDGAANTLDVLAFLNAWNAGDLAADTNFDNQVDTLDVLTFLNIWAQGC
jgi:hypothetical protein